MLHAADRSKLGWWPGRTSRQSRLAMRQIGRKADLDARSAPEGRGAGCTESTYPSEARVRIGLSRSESIELPTRGFSVNRFRNPVRPKVTQEQVSRQICDSVGVPGLGTKVGTEKAENSVRPLFPAPFRRFRRKQPNTDIGQIADGFATPCPDTLNSLRFRAYIIETLLTV